MYIYLRVSPFRAEATLLSDKVRACVRAACMQIYIELSVCRGNPPYCTAYIFSILDSKLDIRYIYPLFFHSPRPWSCSRIIVTNNTSCG